MAGIYVHIPFCRQACHYCDFHFSTSLKTVDRMVQALCTDAQLQREQWQNISFDTVYFGGGTPSVLGQDAFAQLADALKASFQIKAQAEWCLEANPDDLTPEALSFWRDTGVSRLSMGIQSFDPSLLRAMNRSHSAEQALQALDRARSAGFEVFSADLIYGQPGQSLAVFEQDLDTLIAQRPQHISAYCLTVEPKTALDHQIRKGDVALPEESLVEAHYHALCARLAAAGYEHYEVSNWALPGHHSQHNSAYWRGEPYVGIGPSAHGFNGKERYWHVSNNAKYMLGMEAGSPNLEIETLTERDLANERIMTQLRTRHGLQLDWLRKSELVDFDGEMLAALTQFEARGMGVLSSTHFTLNESGLLQADRVASDLFILEE